MKTDYKIIASNGGITFHFKLISAEFKYESNENHRKLCFEINNEYNPYGISNGIYVYVWSSSPSIGLGTLKKIEKGILITIYDPYKRNESTHISLYEAAKELSLEVQKNL